MRLAFSERGWEEYLYWQQTDAKILARINELLKDCRRSPFSGIGHPEPLKNKHSGYWSRRITKEHRLVYLVEQDAIIIAQCRWHYDKR